MVPAITARGTVLLMISKGLFLVGSVIIHVLLGRILGPGDYGRYGLAMSILLWFEVIVNSTVPWAVSKVISEQKTLARAVFRQGAVLQLIFSLAVLALFLALSPTLARALGDRTMKILLWWAALDIPLFALVSICLTYFNGLQQFARQGVVLTSRILFKVLATILFVVAGLSVRGALLANVLGSAVALALGFYLIRLPQPTGDGIRLIDRVLSFGVPYTLFLLSAQLLMNVDLWSVKILLKQSASVGFYASAQTISRVPYFLFLGLTAALFPALSQSTSSGRTEVSRVQIKQALRLLALALLPAGAIITSAPRAVVGLFYGVRFSPAVLPLAVLIWGMILFTVFFTLAIILSAAGRPLTALLYSLALILVDAFLNGSLVPRMGLVGAALATTITGLLGTVILAILVFRQFQVLFQGRSLIKMILTAALIFSLSVLVPLEGSLFVLKCLFLFALYVGGLAVLREVGKEDFRRIRSLWPTFS
jgi:stage V sporulation protein B